MIFGIFQAQGKQQEYDKALDFGQAATAEASACNESPVDDEAKMSLLKTRWNALRKSIEHLRYLSVSDIK